MRERNWATAECVRIIESTLASKPDLCRRTRSADQKSRYPNLSVGLAWGR